MKDKPQDSRRPRATGLGRPVRAPKSGPGAAREGLRGPGAKPVRGPAAGRGKATAGGRPTRGATPKLGGVDRFAVERLEQEGLLTAEGRRLLEGARGTPKGPRKAADKPGRAAGPPRAVLGQPRKASETSRGAADQPRGAGDQPRRVSRPPVGLSGPVAAGPRPLRSAVRPARAPDSSGLGKPERLHKVMAQAGVASRRHSEELIQAGRVSVNGQPVKELGTKVIAGKDRIEVDGRPLGKPESLIHIMLNKPKGVVTTLFDPQGRQKVTDLLGDGVAERVYPVGRLDYETEGLLLLTNDGDLANALMHPSLQVKKTYIAKVRGVPGPAKLKALETGIELEDGPTAPADVKLLEAKGPNAATLSIRIHEGRNRQVRRMFEALGHEVIHLKRSTLGPLHLNDLPVGQWRVLTEQELNELRRAVGLRVPRAATAIRAAAPTARPKGGRRAGGRPQRGLKVGRTGPGAPKGGSSRSAAPRKKRPSK